MPRPLTLGVLEDTLHRNRPPVRHVLADAIAWTSRANPDVDEILKRTIAIVEAEPIDIVSGATYLTATHAKGQTLWTAERMRKLLSACASNGVAVEIGERHKLPAAAFIRLGTEMGVKFTFESDNASAGLSRCGYGIRMAPGRQSRRAQGLGDEVVSFPLKRVRILALLNRGDRIHGKPYPRPQSVCGRTPSPGPVLTSGKRPRADTQ